MATIKAIDDPESNPRVKAVFDDIRATRGNDFINNIWRYIAFDPDLLERTWNEIRDVMARPSSLDPLTKELIYVAVSVTNNCDYCIHSHTAAARAKGMTDEQYGEFIQIVSLAAKTNQLSNALKLPLDDVFDADKA